MARPRRALSIVVVALAVPLTGCGGREGADAASTGTPSAGALLDSGAPQNASEDGDVDASTIETIDDDASAIGCLGGPLVVARAEGPFGRIDRLVSDGTRLFVFQQEAPQLWMMPVAGGPRTTLFADSTQSISSTWSALARDDGVFFVEPRYSSDALAFATPGELRTIAAELPFGPLAGFARDDLVLVPNDGSGAILGVSIATGARRTIASISGSPDVYAAMTTTTKVHAIVVASDGTSFSDVRVALDEPTTRETIALPIEGGDFLSGPSTVYFARDYDDVLALPDSEVTPRAVPKIDPLARPLFADGGGLYVATGDVKSDAGVTRVWGETMIVQRIASGLSGNVTAIGADLTCVYVATTTGEIDRLTNPMPPE